MKKNFFKKLSFVMALAMLISCIAPAAGAFAATSPALNATTKYLHLSGISGPSEYDFNIKNKQSGWKYAWSSANENVAVVDAATGLTTATGVGSTKVTVDITKAGKAVKSLSATVVVRDNIETVKISNAPEKALAVNAEYDLNRSFVTESGSTTKTSSITRWTVDSDKATIDNAGVFKATEAGAYKVTALAFQSTAKYEAWKVSKDANLVLATDEITVTVVPGIVETKQSNTTKFTVKFDSDMSKTDIKTGSTVYQIINGKQVSTGTEKIKSLTLDTTGKVATVEMYTALNPKTEYNFVYKDLVGKFTAASTDLKDVAGIVFDDFTVNITGNTDMKTKISAVNKDGVVILSGSDISSYLTFSYGGDQSQGYTVGNVAYIWKKGYVAPVTVKFETYLYNETTKTYDKVSFTDSATATGVETDTALNASSIQYAISNSGTPAPDSTAWGAALAIPAGDGGFSIYARYKVNSDDSSAAYKVSNDGPAAGSNIDFTYTSSNTDKLIISGTTFYPIAAGTVTVIVKNGETVVGTFDVVIQSSRSFAVAAQDTASVTVGNNSTLGETKTVTVTTKDSMAAAFAPTVDKYSGADFTIVNRPTGAGVVDPAVAVRIGSGNDLGKVFIDVTGQNHNVPATVGAYNIKVTLKGFGATKDVYVTAVVLDGTTDNTVVNWAVELGKTSVDLKENTGDAVSVNVYGYNSKGVRVDQLTAGTEYTITVKHSDNNPVLAYANDSVPVVSGVSGSALTFDDKDTYVVTAYVVGNAISGRVAGSYIGAATFTVADSTTKVVGTDTTVVSASAATVKGAVMAAFNFTLNGTKISDASETANITAIKYTNGGVSGLVTDAGASAIANGDSIYVSEVQYTVTNSNGTKTVYTFSVGATIKVIQ